MIGISEQKKRYEPIQDAIDGGVFLWGAGANGGWCFDYCKRAGIEVNGFIDQNKSISHFEGVKIISPEIFRRDYFQKPILVTAKHSAGEIINCNKDIPNIMSFDSFFLIKNLHEYESIEFEDKESYRVLNYLKKYMYTSEPTTLYAITCHNQYFAVAPFFNTGKEGFVDLGAYTGDTIEMFLFEHHGAFSHIWAFEPGQKQFAALEFRTKRLVEEWALEREKITLENKGIGGKSECLYVTEGNNLLGMQLSAHGEKKITVVSLDDYFEREDNVTFIKADIEGLEYETFCGAKKLIQKLHPKLAVSVYHKPDDLIRIYNLIKSYDCSYKFSLRNHSSLMMETVLYCY